MDIRAFQDSDTPALVDLTIATFRPLYGQLFLAMMHHDRPLIEHQQHPADGLTGTACRCGAVHMPLVVSPVKVVLCKFRQR